MIFLIGSQKSGTTWLRNCFAHKCKISLNSELYFPELLEQISLHIEKYAHSLSEQERQDAISRSATAAWQEVLSSVKAGATADKSAYPCLKSKSDKIRNDLHPFAVSLAKKYIANAKTVVIVRDPRAVLNSLLHFRRALKAKKRGPVSQIGFFARNAIQSQKIDDFAKNWEIQNSQWISDKPDAVIKYEDLKTDFSEQLGKAFSAAGISINTEEMKNIEGLEYDIDKNRHRQKALYRKGEIDDWKEHLSRSQISKIEDNANELMTELGYL